jgi:hypothetical protein
VRAGTISHCLHRQDQHRQRWNGENRRPPKTLKFGENEPETKKLKSSKTLKNFQSFLNFHFVVKTGSKAEQFVVRNSIRKSPGNESRNESIYESLSFRGSSQ